MAQSNKQPNNTTEEIVIDKIFTIPNVISLIRLCLVPIYLVLLLEGHNIMATFLFAVAAGTDFIDGQVARRTNTVSRLGQVLDPAIDRILMIAGVGGLLMVGRLPLWIVLVVLIRDLFLLVGGSYLIKRYSIRIPVVYSGKVATTFLFVGFAGMLLNWPLIPGFGWCTFSWLPGFNAAMVSWGIWFVYLGLILALVTTLHYVRAAIKEVQRARKHPQSGVV
ncbi:MAG: CDP-alcohol phosphatidyltransferase family protein [Raoultibacter sp.]